MTTCYSFSDPQFTPANREIDSITQDNPATITTTLDHLYKDGLKVRIEISKFHGQDIFGMQQMDGLIGTITIVDSTNFTIDIDTTRFDPFSIPGMLPSAFTCPQVVPVAEVSETLDQAVKNTSGKRNNVV